jgi:peptidoglycan/xylan/chitin deacetylase (PgdA/CDA1 family)
MSAVSSLDIYLKGYRQTRARSYLSENDLQVKFSALKKVYYGVARPVLPLVIRHWLQGQYTRRVDCHPQFIWADLVAMLKSDEAAWRHFVGELYPHGYATSIILTHDVETQKGFDFIPKVIELEAAYGFRGSWNLVASKYELHREITDLIISTGNEIGIHGYNHDGTLYYSKSRFLKRARRINEAIEKYGAVGFRSPQVHRNLGWLQHLNILYDASCFDYDPYQPFPGGTGAIWPFIAGKFVELPYTVPQDHVLFYILKMKDISVWKSKVDWLVANSGMILTLTHPDYLAEGDHLKLYEQFLGYLTEVRHAWHCLPREMAEWYLKIPD